MCLIQQTGISQEQISVISRFAMASIGSQGTVGGLVVAGFVSKISLHKLFIDFKVHLPHDIAFENRRLACIGWCWRTLWLCLFLRTTLLE